MIDIHWEPFSNIEETYLQSSAQLFLPIQAFLDFQAEPTNNMKSKSYTHSEYQWWVQNKKQQNDNPPLAFLMILEAHDKMVIAWKNLEKKNNNERIKMEREDEIIGYSLTNANFNHRCVVQ